MSLGKVITWQMTESERLAYIEKHPIVPTEKPTGATFSNIYTLGERVSEKQAEKIIDRVDKDQLHKLFLSGKRLDDIAKALNISSANLNRYISDQRKEDPEKWPYRAKK
jgi:DNA invertase Pin-like site-specific DNA recombinase